jgi:hypothetical protein
MLKAAAVFTIFFGFFGLGVSSALLGDTPLINTAQTTSNINLNFTAAGTHQQIALILIHSNDPAGFHVVFTFQNKGFFTVGTRQFAMTSIVLNKVSGTIGSGLTDPVDMPIVLDGAGTWTWSPSPPLPTTETDGYLLEIAVNWANPASGLAGFYQERITCTIVSGP